MNLASSCFVLVRAAVASSTGALIVVVSSSFCPKFYGRFSPAGRMLIDPDGSVAKWRMCNSYSLL